MRPGGVPKIFGFTALDHKGQTIESIPSVEEFQRNLLRERYRADRNGHMFSILTISIEHLKDSQISVPALADFVLRRVRLTDYVGWFDSQNLGVLLPDTPEAGAWKLAEDICVQISASIPRLVCEVFSYPVQNPLIDEQGQPTGGQGTDSSRRLEANPAGCSASTTVPECQSPGCDAADTGQCDDTPWRIHPFFAHRIPVWKRLLDIVGSLMALLFLTPLFALITLVIKMVSPGPVFFKQERIGYLGKPFMFWKFRTMQVDSNNTRHKQHMSSLMNSDIPMKKLDSSDDPRIIPFGIFLRKSCLDELPQLINVLLGDMSLVGPRPCLPYEAQHYLRWHARRFDSVPGMTGLWQVSGKNRTTFREMIRLDINYERQMSIWLDLKILLKTIPAIFSMATESLIPAKERLDGRRTA